MAPELMTLTLPPVPPPPPLPPRLTATSPVDTAAETIPPPEPPPPPTLSAKRPMELIPWVVILLPLVTVTSLPAPPLPPDPPRPTLTANEPAIAVLAYI